MDAALGVCSQPSAIDVNWLHTLLTERPMATRDALLVRIPSHRLQGKGNGLAFD